MCSRFEQKSRAEEVAKQYGLTNMPPLVNAPDIRPTDQALVITTNGQAKLLAWGFDVPWDSKPLINARSETLREAMIRSGFFCEIEAEWNAMCPPITCSIVLASIHIITGSEQGGCRQWGRRQRQVRSNMASRTF